MRFECSLRYVTINVEVKIILDDILELTYSWFLLSFMFTTLKDKSFPSFQQQTVYLDVKNSTISRLKKKL